MSRRSLVVFACLLASCSDAVAPKACVVTAQRDSITGAIIATVEYCPPGAVPPCIESPTNHCVVVPPK